MNYRPYPDVDRALHQVQRARVRPYHYIRQLPDGTIAETHIFPTAALAGLAAAMRSAGRFTRSRASQPTGALAWIDEHLNLDLAPWQRQFLNEPRRTGKSALTAAIVDQAVKAGEHVHVAERSGFRCLGSDGTCTTVRGPRADLQLIDDAEVSGE